MARTGAGTVTERLACCMLSYSFHFIVTTNYLGLSINGAEAERCARGSPRCSSCDVLRNTIHRANFTYVRALSARVVVCDICLCLLALEQCLGESQSTR